jgi:asparagine synthase (glutamine-hydrolysing)
MCGFVAFLQDEPQVDLETARRALARIAHRGPDAAGEWHERAVLLLHRRLSIIDLNTGQQPMQSHDGRYVIVFNGEIYNFLELRNQLEEEGSRFNTRSDTEVILEGYRCWGKRVVERLNGMFAFVIWDRAQSLAFGARDRVGIKPLCWAMHRSTFIASSTLEPFGALEGFDRLDPVAVRDLMTFDNIPSPRTIIRGVRKLNPGCRFFWRFGADEPLIERYWAPPLVDEKLEAPTQGELEELLDRAVKRQMISDVSIGVFLSGGIDSSLVAALMSRHSEKPIRTFSIAFDNPAMDESPIAGKVARQFGTDHTVLRAEGVGAEALLDLLGRLDEPLADAAVVPTYALSKMTADHVKVALSGDGGDEVFGGYPKYFLGRLQGPGFPLQPLLHQALRAFPWKPRGMLHLYWRTLSSQERIRWSFTTYGDFPVFRRDLRQVLMPPYYESAQIDEYFGPWERRARRYGVRYDTDLLMRTDLETYLSENCLVKTDRASMLASLEVRVPFLDNQVLDRIVPLPADKKIVNGALKALLLPLVKRILPREVWDRPKHGFSMPLDTWLKGEWRPAVEAALNWGEANMDLLNFRYLRRLHKINVDRGGIGRELWNPFVFLAWAMAHKVK